MHLPVGFKFGFAVASAKHPQVPNIILIVQASRVVVLLDCVEAVS